MLGCRTPVPGKPPAHSPFVGVPEADRERVLQRFVRLDGTRSTPGNGLGLSLVDAVARLHGAALTLEDNRPGLKVSLAFRGQREDREGGHLIQLSDHRARGLEEDSPHGPRRTAGGTDTAATKA